MCNTISIISDRNSLKSGLDMLTRMLHSLSNIVLGKSKSSATFSSKIHLKKAATWWFSSTDRSLYMMARLELDMMWKLLVVPVWS